LYKGKPKKGGKPEKAFTLHHCWVLLEHDERRRRRNNEVSTKSKNSSNSCSLVDDEHAYSTNEDSDGRRSLTLTSVPPKKRLLDRKA
jgi:hypothetical protein